MPKRSKKGATRKRPAVMSTAAPGSPEQPNTSVEGSQQPTGAGATSDDNIYRHHTNMVTDLGKLFPPGRHVWTTICKRIRGIKEVKFIVSKEDVDNIPDLCTRMMKKKNAMNYKDYMLLRKILETKEAVEIIEDCKKEIFGDDQNQRRPQRTSVVFEDEDETDPPQDKRKKTKE